MYLDTHTYTYVFICVCVCVYTLTQKDGEMVTINVQRWEARETTVCR